MTSFELCFHTCISEESSTEKEDLQSLATFQSPPKADFLSSFSRLNSQFENPDLYKNSPFSFSCHSGAKIHLEICQLCNTQDGALGGVLWKASDFVNEWVIEKQKEHVSFWKNKLVLELGAGVGLCSALLFALGASVITTDQAPILKLLTRNVMHNCLELDKRKEEHGEYCSVDELDWGSEEQLEKLIQRNKVKKLDWVVAADVAYSLECVQALVVTFHQCFERFPDLSVLLAFTIREKKTDALLNSLLFSEFHVEFHDVRKNQGAGSDLVVFVLRRKRE